MEGVASKLRAKAVALGAAAAVAAGTPLGTPLGGQGGGPPLLQPAPARAVTFHDQASSPHEILHHALPLDGDVHDNPAVKVETMLGELNLPPARAAGRARSIRQANYAARSFEPAEARAVVARCQAALADRAAVLATVPAENRVAAGAKMDQLGGELRALGARLEGGRTIGADELRAAQEDLLVRVLQLEAEYLDVDHAGAIPPELAGRPILNGRATVDLDILMRSRVDATGGAPLERVTIMVDGANAPVTAGNFVDLVQKGFYHGMQFQRADGFVVQTGDPNPGDDREGRPHGYAPQGVERRIPLEYAVKGDSHPTYNATLDDTWRFDEPLELPFNALGTVAMARNEDQLDSASSQFFILNKESEVTPSGANILDGRYAVFGYVIKNADVLADLKPGDVIQSVRVTDGAPRLAAARAEEFA